MRFLSLTIFLFTLISCNNPNKENKSSDVIAEEKSIVIDTTNKISSNNTSVEGNTNKITIRDRRNGISYDEAKLDDINYENLPDSFKIMIKTVKKFEAWYGENHEILAQHKLFKFSDALGYYIFDMEHGNFYLNTLQETGLVSDSLIKYFRNMFLDSQADLEKEKQGYETDGPIGYVADIITGWQEDPLRIDTSDYIVDEISIGDNSIRVNSVYLIYENGHWLVLGY